MANDNTGAVERVQVNMRLEKRLVKVLKAVAELHDDTLSQALEDIVLHAFEGASPYAQPDDLRRIGEFRALYGMDTGTVLPGPSMAARQQVQAMGEVVFEAVPDPDARLGPHSWIVRRREGDDYDVQGVFPGPEYANLFLQALLAASPAYGRTVVQNRPA
jgi:hypothetical protein